MSELTVYWLLFMVLAFTTMFIIMPREKILELLTVGFWMGLVQAVVLLWLGQVYLQVFRLSGDPTAFGIPMIASFSWLPAVVLFAYYFIQTSSAVKRIGLVLLFAAGSVVVQYILQRAGLWENLNWNLYYTFMLTLAAHTLISGFIVLTRKQPDTRH